MKKNFKKTDFSFSLSTAWTDTVKTSHSNELPPQNIDWYVKDFSFPLSFPDQTTTTHLKCYFFFSQLGTRNL